MRAVLAAAASAAGLLGAAVAWAADDALLTWTLADGSTAAETRPLEAWGDVSSLTVPAAEIRAKRAKGLVVTPSFGRAKKGEAGYWFSPYGYYGEWDCDNGTFEAYGERMNMPMYGWSIVVNYKDEAFAAPGVEVEAQGWRLFRK